MGKICRYKPEAKNYFVSGYSGFRDGITFGTRKQAQIFITKLKKRHIKSGFNKIYKKFRIRKICD